jgi:hypothetical protein
VPKGGSKSHGKSPQGKCQGHLAGGKGDAWVVKPGQKTPQSGIYKPSKGGAEVALSKGDRVPPTKKGGTFVFKTATVGRAKDRSTGRLNVGGDWSDRPPPPPPKDRK